MVNTRNRFPGRRRFLKQSAALSAGAAALAVPFAGIAAAPGADAQTTSPADGAQTPAARTPVQDTPRKPHRSST